MKRKGFGLITAIIIMMVIAILMSLTMGLSSTTVKHTTDVYLKEQAKLLLRSSVEYALLAISGHDNSGDCVESVTINYPQFTSNVDIWYMGRGIPAGCNKILANNIQTDDSNYTAIIDVTVTTNASTEPITLHRRTIQKP